MGGISGPNSFDPKNTPIKRPSSTEETGQVRTKAPDAPALTPTESPATSTAQTSLPKRPDVHRQYTNDDIKQLLLKFDKPLKDPSSQIMTSIMEYGLAASGENFDHISRLLKGRKDPKSIQSSVVTLLKGLKDASKTVDILSAFFKGNTANIGLLSNLQQQMGGLSKLLKRNQDIFDKGLHSGLTSIISDLDDSIDSIIKNKKEFNIDQLRRKGVFSDFKTFFDFLGGVSKKISDGDQGSSASGKQLLKGLKNIRLAVSEVLNNVASQAVLSKDSIMQIVGQDQFAYWQIPNPMAQMPKSMDLLISKQKKTKKSVLDPRKVRVILRFDTPELGDIAVEMDVLDKQVWTIFYAKNPDTKLYINKLSADLRDRLKANDYDMVGFQVKNKKLDIKKLLLPKFELDRMSHISTEI